MLESNHDSGRNSEVKGIDLCEIIEESGKILFVGEGDFTFTLAFAAWRQSKTKNKDRVWTGITSTHYESEFSKPVFVWPQVKDACTTNIKRNSKRLLERGYKDRVKLVEDMPEIPSAEVKYRVDARAIPQSLIPPVVIWFQCPWDGQDTTGNLVKDFLVNTIGKLVEGTYVCLGITRQFPYITSYKLESILGANLNARDNSTEVLQHYKFLGADDDLIRDILTFGYHHLTIHGDRDIHKQIIMIM